MKYTNIISLGLILLASRPSTQKTIGGRIIGGQDASAGQFPFAAAINIQTQNSRHFCGGVLIDPLWVLTAAHCIESATSATIQLGSNILTGADSNRVIVATENFVVHPLFDIETLDNDIGLIMFRQKVQLTDYIQSTHFFPVIDLPGNSRVTTLGWGQTTDQTEGPVNNLQFVQLVTLSDNECRAVYGPQITDSMICIEGNLNEGACIGDSGSPLIQNVAAQHTVIVGVSSFISQNGCESLDPSGYTRVFPFKQWISNVTGILI